MDKINRDDLMSLEEYAQTREKFRAKVMQHKKDRRLAIGPNASLIFENRLTIQYQVQEMLRIERIFEAKGINDELETYNPLIPDGSNWKAILMIEYATPAERKDKLAKLVGIEDSVWLAINGMQRVKPICDEDIERSTDEKTSAVHFLRFELPEGMITQLKAGVPLSAGIEHEFYNYMIESIPEAIRSSLVHDLD